MNIWRDGPEPPYSKTINSRWKMVLESMRIDWIEHRPYISFFFGFIYVIIGYFIAGFFFDDTSIAMLFLATLLIVPSLIKLIEVEEKRESRYGLKHFFREHRDILEAYVFLFVGVFAGYALLGFFAHDFNSIFQFQLDFLMNQQGLSQELVDRFFEGEITASLSHVAGVLENNLMVMLICFVLSLFYGVGAIFLITLNASVFASFIVYVSDYIAKEIGHVFLITGLFMIHMVPEIAGFLIAAIAGGVLSKALVGERWKSERFRNVFKDSLMLLVIACALVLAAAFLEVYVTAYLFHGLV
ncbi:MAG: stage II sporulation protein M [Candidatus Woesearchaeota archaeon]